MDKKEKGAKQTSKKRQKQLNLSAAIVADSESDSELPDYGNGLDTTLTENDDNISNDGGWISDDDRQLVEKIKSTTKPNDKVNFKTKLKQMNWSEIAFKHHTAEDCEKRFSDHLKHVRRHRNLNEVATDVEANIKKCLLKKPLNSYQIFVQDQLANATTSGDFTETMKNLAARYRELSLEQRAVYLRKAEQLKNEHSAKKYKYESGNVSKPKSSGIKAKTPFVLFAENNTDEESDFNKLREKYANMSMDEKYKWVIKAVSLAPEMSVTDFLNKEEQRILNGQVKTTPTAYSLFVKDTYRKTKEAYDLHDIFAEVARRWKALAPNEKKRYADAAAILKEKAANEQNEFNARHGLTKQSVKRRKSVYVEPIERSSDQENEASPSKSKKRKFSSSSAAESAVESTSSADDATTKQNKIKSPTKNDSSKLNSELTLPSPIKTVEKKKLNSMSESGDNNDRSESDVASSSTSTSSKKKAKKEKKKKKSKIVQPPTDKPPSTPFKYFAKYVHTGKASKAQKAYDRLTKKESKHLMAEFNEKIESYVVQLKKYLSSLSNEDARAYISKVKAAEEAENQQNEDSSQEY